VCVRPRAIWRPRRCRLAGFDLEPRLPQRRARRPHPEHNAGAAYRWRLLHDVLTVMRSCVLTLALLAAFNAEAVVESPVAPICSAPPIHPGTGLSPNGHG